MNQVWVSLQPVPPTIYFFVKKKEEERKCSGSDLKVSSAPRFNSKGFSIASDIRLEGGGPTSFDSHALKEVNPTLSRIKKLPNGRILIQEDL